MNPRRCSALSILTSLWRIAIPTIFTFAATLSILAPRSVWAQAASATLRGDVTDETGAALPDVQIALRNTLNDFERRATSDHAGLFIMSFLPPGRYTLTAQREGFATTELRDVVLNVNDQLSLAIQLNVKSATEVVTVVAEPTHASTSPSVGTVVDRQFVANIPLNGRSLHALLQLVPGVVITSNTTASTTSATAGEQFSVNGQRPTSNYVMVDGVGANTGMNVGNNLAAGEAGGGQSAGTTALGGTNSLVSLDALQEFRIETSTFAPEFGHALGGQISLVTRAGTNVVHGSGSEYFRHESLDANDWFANSTNQPKARERQYLFSGVIGGPIRPNRLFFFGSYEGLRLTQPRAAVVAVPTAELRAQAPLALQPYLNAFPLPNGPASGDGSAQFAASYSDSASFDVSSIRVDLQATDRINGFLRASHGPSATETRTQGLSTVATVDAKNTFVTGGLTWVGSSRVTADIRLNWTRNPTTQRAALDTIGGAVVPAVADVFPPGWSPSTGTSVFGAFSQIVWGPGNGNTQQQFNVVGVGSIALSSHQVKFGVDYRRLFPLISSAGQLFESTFFTPPTIAQDILAGQAPFYRITNIDPQPREAIFPSLSLYLQDVWRAQRRLTVTYGIRFEHVPPPSEATGRLPRTLLGIDSDVLTNPRLAPEGTPLWQSRFGELAPRLGASYQLSTRAAWETSVRGGFGVFYDPGTGDVATAFQLYPYQAAPNFSSASFPLTQAVRTQPKLGVDAPALLWLMDPHARLPYALQWNATIEQALGMGQSLTIGYVGAAGRRLLVNQLYRQPLQEWPNTRTTLEIQRNIGRSRYDAFQLKYERRLLHGLQFFGAYTLARSQDNASAADNFVPPASQATILAQEWGPSDFDVRHQLSAAITYELQVQKGTKIVQMLSRGWGVDVLARVQSPRPVSPSIGNLNVPETGGFYSRRPDYVPGQSLYVDDPSAPGGRRFNAAAFTTPAPNTQGDFMRNGLRGFWASQVDLAIRREFHLSGPIRLQIKAELFNVFNHPNFAGPDGSVTSSLFGRPTAMLNRGLGGLNALYQMGGPRSGEFVAKILF